MTRTHLLVLVCALAALATATRASAAPDDPFFSSWETLGPEQGLPSAKVTAVAVDGARVWVGTDNGLAWIEQGQVESIGEEQGLPFRVISALAVDPRSGDLWIGTLGGLARYSAGRIEAFTQLDSGLANDVVYGVALDGDDVWVATAAGLSRFALASRSWEIHDTSNTLMHEPWCYGVTTDNSDVYVAVWGGGVLVRDGRSGVFREHRDPDGEAEIDLYRDDGLVHDVTSSISVARGVMWVGTYFGLSRYDGRRWRSYCKTDSGLAGDFVNRVLADGEVVWVATDQGLSRFDSRRWHTWQRSQANAGWTLTISEQDGARSAAPAAGGPASNTVYDVAVDGADVWLATAAGLSHGVAHPAPRKSPDPDPDPDEENGRRR